MFHYCFANGVNNEYFFIHRFCLRNGQKVHRFYFNISMGKKVCTHYGKKGHIVDACYRKHGYPPSWGTGRGSAYANNVGFEFQEIDVELKMKVTYEGNRYLTQDKYNVMIALLEKNGINGTNHVTNMVRGDSSNCYFAEVAGKYHTHESKSKDSYCNWILDTGETYHICNSID